MTAIRLEPNAVDTCTFSNNMVSGIVVRERPEPCGPQTRRRRLRWRLVGLTERFLWWVMPGVK